MHLQLPYDQHRADIARTAAIWNGEIVSDSESDNTDDYTELTTVVSSC